MSERIPTLILYAKSRPHWRRVVADTLVEGLRLRPELVPRPLWRSRRVRFLFAEEYRTLSYMVDWQEAFCEDPSLESRAYNINNLVGFSAALRALKRVPLVIILHSAACDDLSVLRRASAYLQGRRGKVILFLGNEYNGMPDKIGFAREIQADYIASQLPAHAATWLYTECRGSKVLLSPPALNPKLYHPQPGPRPIDIGFRGDLYAHSFSLGDLDRPRLLRLFAEQAHQWGLVTDIEFVRHPREEWSRFLGRCKGVVGVESGTAYLERDDRTQEAVKRYVQERPDVTFEEVYDRFFRAYPHPISGKAISSRHFEPVGTKTCQILLEGQYNGILKAGEHYIAVKKDLSNVDQAIRQFKDETFRRGIVDRTYDYVMAEHTYQHRVRAVLEAVKRDGLPAW